MPLQGDIQLVGDPGSNPAQHLIREVGIRQEIVLVGSDTDLKGLCLSGAQIAGQVVFQERIVCCQASRIHQGGIYTHGERIGRIIRIDQLDVRTDDIGIVVRDIFRHIVINRTRASDIPPFVLDLFHLNGFPPQCTPGSDVAVINIKDAMDHTPAPVGLHRKGVVDTAGQVFQDNHRGIRAEYIRIHCAVHI